MEKLLGVESAEVPRKVEQGGKGERGKTVCKIIQGRTSGSGGTVASV